MDGLITSPEQLQQERSLAEPATKEEVRHYVVNHDKNVIIPALQTLSTQIAALHKQQQAYATVVNNLIDYLESDGLRTHADGRFRLNQQEWQAWLKKRAMTKQAETPQA
jgi:hypothetical protein